MVIAIDCRWISTDTGGIRQYTLSLVKNLAKIDEKNQYLLLFDEESTAEKLRECVGQKDKFSFQRLEYGPFSLKSQLFLPHTLQKGEIDIFHSPSFMIPIFSKSCKIVITLHDLIPYLHPELCPRSKKSRFLVIYKTLQKAIMKRINKVITVSEHSRRDILKAFPGLEEKVKVVYNGIDEKFCLLKDEKLQKEIRESYDLKKGVILYVGRQDPAKNLVTLIKSFSKLHGKTGEYCLVIVGKKDERYPEPYQLVEQLQLEKDVIFTGVVENKQLPLFYNVADLFVFPSLYEGFGLPPLEAMACGCPVITSNTSSLPEVVGAAGIMVDPYNIDGLAEAMYKVLSDKDLRQEMVRRGLEKAKIFSWEKTAERTLSIYEEVIQNK